MISKNNHQGATLVELIISIGIMGVLIGATISNFHGGNKNESVRLAETVLRQAQTMTLTGALTSGSFPSGGYGARFDIAAPTIIRLFADSNNNHVFDANEEVADERRQLPANASFALGGSLDVVFSSPEGTVFFNGAAVPDTQAILFNAAGSPITKSVIIYRLSGQVRVQ